MSTLAKIEEEHPERQDVSEGEASVSEARSKMETKGSHLPGLLLGRGKWKVAIRFSIMELSKDKSTTDLV